MKSEIIFFFVFFFFSGHRIFSQENKFEIVPCQEIKIGCRIVKHGEKYVIKDEAEYQNFLQSKSSNLLNCNSNDHPAIDFSKYTLLGIDEAVQGCQEPIYQYKVYSDIQNNKCIFDLLITFYGDCSRANPVKIWCLIPKIPDNYVVEYKISKKGYGGK